MADETNLTKPAAEDVVHGERTRCGCHYRPNADILERADELIVLADVPGATGEKIDVGFEDGLLSIHAQVKPRQEDNTDYLVREYGVGDYYRRFHVSEAIDAGRISAKYADGVLTLHLPKAESTKPRKIDVRTG